MRRSSRIASIHGTEWSNQPSIKSQRKVHRSVEQDQQEASATLHDLTKQSDSVVKIHHVIPDYYKITDEQLIYDSKMIQTLMDQVTSNPKSSIGRARELIPFFHYLYTHPSILFRNSDMMDIIVLKIKEIMSEITNKESRLQEYFDVADQMSAALTLQREIGNEILKEGMKSKIEERDVWCDLKTALMKLREILPTTNASTASSACCPHSKKIENNSTP